MRRRLVKLAATFVLLVALLLSGAWVYTVLEPDKDLWTYTNALYFCYTTVTTIGFGNFAPESYGSRWFTIAYCAAGIPVLFAFVAILSDVISDLNRRFVSGVLESCCCLEGKIDVRSPGGERLVAQIGLALSILWIILYVLVSSALCAFLTHESWSDSVYFVVITCTTVGYGDINPFTLGLVDLLGPPEPLEVQSLLTFMALSVLGISSIGIALAALQDYLHLGMDRTYTQMQQLFPTAFPESAMLGSRADLAASHHLENTWLCLAGYEGGALRLWDLDKGSFLLQLGALEECPPLGRRSRSSSPVKKSRSLAFPTPANTLRQRLQLGKGAEPGCTDTPVACSILEEMGRQDDNTVAVSAHRRGELMAWSVAGEIRHLGQVDAVRHPNQVSELTHGRHHGRGQLLCCSTACIAGEEIIVTGDSFGKIGLWSLSSSRRLDVDWAFDVRCILDMDTEVRCVGHVPDNSHMLLSAGGSESLLWSDVGALSVWDLNIERELHRLDHLKSGPVNAIAALDSNTIATGHRQEGVISVWDVRVSRHSRTAESTLTGHAAGVTVLEAVPSQGLLLSASLDGTLAAWDTRKGRPLHVLTGHSGPITAMNVLAGGESLSIRIVSGSTDGCVKLWESANGSGRCFLNRHTFYLPGEHIHGGVTCAAVTFIPQSADGTAANHHAADSQQGDPAVSGSTVRFSDLTPTADAMAPHGTGRPRHLRRTSADDVTTVQAANRRARGATKGLGRMSAGMVSPSSSVPASYHATQLSTVVSYGPGHPIHGGESVSREV